jgi:dihydroorotase
MIVDLIIINAKIPVKNGTILGGIAVEKGKIFAVAKRTNLPKASKKIDAKGKIILPGLIDIHVHLRDLQLSYKEDFYSGTCAAAAGGFTTIFDMPNTKPVTSNSYLLKEKKAIAQSKVVTNIGFYSILPDLEEIVEVIKEKPYGFKLYLNSPFTSLNIADYDVLIRVFNQVKNFDSLILVHAEDQTILMKMENCVKRVGLNKPESHLDAHPPKAEVESIKKIVSLCKNSNIRVHICHVSSTQSLSILSEAKRTGLQITCEATPHHLLLSKDVFSKRGSLAIMNPPLRDSANTKGLWKALTQRLIDVIASDHAPHSLSEKTVEDVWEVPPGIPGLETTLPLLLTKVKENKLSLNLLIELLAHKPAQILRLEKKGYLAEGFDADFTIIDPHYKSIIDSSKFYSKAHYSPFDGYKVIGKPTQTFVRGKLVMDNNQILAKPGEGEVLR